MRSLFLLLALAALPGAAAAQVVYPGLDEPQAPAPAPAPRAGGWTYLTWPGKTQAAAAAPAAAPASYAYARPPSQAGGVPPLHPYQPAQPPLPSSIYEPAPPVAAHPSGRVSSAALPPPAQPIASNGGARLYSLHRPYGAQPDPIQLSPQFLGSSTADMAEPPPPPPRSVTTQNGQVVRTADPPSTPGDLAD